MANQNFEEQAAAVLLERSGQFSRFEMRENVTIQGIYEPFALVEVRASFGAGHGTTEEILHRGYDTADAMYRNVLSIYGNAPTASSIEPNATSARHQLLGRILAALHF